MGAMGPYGAQGFYGYPGMWAQAPMGLGMVPGSVPMSLPGGQVMSHPRGMAPAGMGAPMPGRMPGYPGVMQPGQGGGRMGM